MTAIVVVVTGGREYADASKVFQVLDEVHRDTGIYCLAHGACSGADSYAESWCIRSGVTCAQFPAMWEILGAKAGPIRNRVMLRVTKPDLVLAFPGGRGTANCVAIARSLELNVREVK